MNVNTDLIYDIKRKMAIKYPRFGSEIAASYIEYRDNLKYHTAATDGRNIYIDPNYFQTLSEDERLFIVAHELMHIKFKHMYRLNDKNGEKRNLDLWNTATDAIINANLERDGFTIKQGYVNMPEALKYSAEEFYNILKEKQEQKEQDKSQNGEQGNDTNSQELPKQIDKQEDNRDNVGENQNGDHSLWEEVFKEQEQNDQSENENKHQKVTSQEDNRNQIKAQPKDVKLDEREEFEENRNEKIEKFKERCKKTERNIRNDDKRKISLGNIGESKEYIDWKTLIRKEIEKSETVWSNRRSIAENNYAYRLEEYETEEDAETEIMIDISGSVKLQLVKAFLRQIKPLLKQSKLKVGCFNARFWGFVDIKNVIDIDNFIIPRDARGDSAWTEDWDLAVRSFTKKNEINKIVFTDGYPGPGNMPKEDLKRENVIWLVYGNKDFEPCCGKVININEKQIEQLQQVEKI